MQEQLMVFYKITEFQIDIHTLFTKISKDPYIQYFQSQIFDFISFIMYDVYDCKYLYAITRIR